MARSAKFDERKAHIARIAAQLFAQRGYHATSVSDIAKAASAAKSRLYYYYPSKEHLLYGLLHAHATLVNFRLGGAVNTGGTTKARLHIYVKELLAINVRARNEHAIILSELDNLSPQHKTEITSLLRAPIEGLYGLLCELNPSLAQNPAKKFPAAMLLFGMINWSHTWFDENGPLSAAQYADMVCDTFLAGFPNAEL